MRRIETTDSPLILDISRLLWRGRRPAPTGIDRVELAYARRYLASQDSGRYTYAVLHLFGLLFVISPKGAKRFVDDLTLRWEGQDAMGHGAEPRSVWSIYGRVLGSLLLGGMYPLALRRWWGPKHAIFIVVSHHHVASQPAIRRLCRSYGLKTVCFVHDLLAVDYPEFFPRWWAGWFTRIAKNSRDSFDAIIVNSECTAKSLSEHHYLQGGASAPPVFVAPLGTRVFPHTPVPADLKARPYFVILGTIEPRKNHLMLLNLWARMAELHDPSHPVPRLIVIGARGWENEQIIDMLERSKRIRRVVTERNNVADPELAEILSGARALLMPSMAEGYGMPLAEALGSGIPVICSDIPVFREIGLDAPDFIDPLDTKAWQARILEYAQPDSTVRQAQMERLTQWSAPTWAQHFQVVERMLHTLDEQMPTTTIENAS